MPGSDLLGASYFVMVATAILKDKDTGVSHASGVSVRKEIEATTKRRFGIGTVCAALDRLEKSGYLKSEVSDRDGRRPKRFYYLTSRGNSALAEALKESGSILDHLKLASLPAN